MFVPWLIDLFVRVNAAHLLASAAMDHTICIWNVWSTGQKLAFKSNFHNAAVKDVQWSQQGLSVLSCGYDCASRLIDVEKGTEVGVFKEDQGVAVVKFHPNNPNLFLSGGLKGSLRMWDMRIGKMVNKYNRRLGPILDVEFTPNSNQFISSSDVSTSNSSESSIIIWDVTREVPLSYQACLFSFSFSSLQLSFIIVHLFCIIQMQLLCDKAEYEEKSLVLTLCKPWCYLIMSHHSKWFLIKKIHPIPSAC